MDVQFLGFRSSFPPYIYLIILVIVTGISVWSYQSLKDTSWKFKSLLILLRSTAFFILIVILLNPVFSLKTTLTQKRPIAVLLDNSKSIGIIKGQYHGMATYDSVLSIFNQIDTSSVRFDYYSIGDRQKHLNKASVVDDENATNIAAPINAIARSDTSYSAIILLSDGIYNQGESPSSIRSVLPVDVIALGDTSSVPDVILKDLSYPVTAYKDTKISVSASIEHTGYAGRQASVHLMRGNRIIANKEIRLAGPRGIQTVTFSFTPHQGGTLEYRIDIPKLKNEWSDNNNSRSFHISIQNNRIRVLNMTFEVHPDVKTVRSILGSDTHIQLRNINLFDTSGRPDFSSIPPKDSVDVIVLQGFPQKGSSSTVNRSIQNLTTGKPCIIIATPGTDLSKLNSLYAGSLPLVTGPGRWQTMITIKASDSAGDSPVIDGLSFPADEIPPHMYTYVGDVLRNTGANILLESNIYGSNRNIPILAVNQSNNNRVAELLLTGFYHMQQSADPVYRESIQKLIKQLLLWTSSNPGHHLLQINPDQKEFTDAEDVTFSAEVHDQSGQPLNDANIVLNIGKGTQLKSYDMQSDGNGHYSLDAQRMSGGIYHYKAIAVIGDQKIDSANGTFSISATNIEYTETRRNDLGLKLLAHNSGGFFLTFEQAAKLPDSLKKAGIMKPLKIQNNRDLFLYHYPWWLIAVLILLTAEWILRKRKSLP